MGSVFFCVKCLHSMNPLVQYHPVAYTLDNNCLLPYIDNGKRDFTG